MNAYSTALLRGGYRLVAAAGAGALIVGAALVVGASLARSADAQETPVPAAAGITVIGQGTAKGQPDATTVQLGIEVSTQTPAEALDQTRQRAERVIQRMRALGVPETDIQTSNFNVNPFREPRPMAAPGTPPEVTGYRGYATLTVLAPSVGQVSALLTAAVEAGANSVQGLSFGIRDQAPLRLQALQAAIADARPKAEAAAAAAGLQLGGVRSIVEVSSGGPIVHEAMAMGAGGEGIAPGQLTVGVRVQVTFDVVR